MGGGGGLVCVNTTFVEQASRAHLSASKNLFMAVYSSKRCTVSLPPPPPAPPSLHLPPALSLHLGGQAWSYRVYNMPTRDI